MFETPLEATCTRPPIKKKYQDGQSSTLIKSRCSPFISVRPGLVPNFPRPLPPEMWRPQTSTSLMFPSQKITLKQMGVFAQIGLRLSFPTTQFWHLRNIFQGHSSAVVIFHIIMICCYVLFLRGNSWIVSRTSSFSDHEVVIFYAVLSICSSK